VNIDSIKPALMNKLKNVRYRRAFADANVGARIASQLQSLRKSRGLNQEKLAEELGMAQARISLMERPDYQAYSVRTLKRIAAYFDVALLVEFVSFTKLVDRIMEQSAEDQSPPSFEQALTQALKREEPFPLFAAQHPWGLRLADGMPKPAFSSFEKQSYGVPPL
jgi:transcriptional regulator with XRE-family HTH domain